MISVLLLAQKKTRTQAASDSQSSGNGITAGAMASAVLRRGHVTCE